MKQFFLFIFAAVMIIGCSRNAPEIDKHFESALAFREADELGKSISELMAVIEQYPDHPRASEAQFEIGKIYLNDVKDYSIAIDEFQKVIDNFPGTENAAKALFMIGYINANNVQAYSLAYEQYNQFIAEYPDHELVPSVQFELESMEPIMQQIEDLNSQANAN